MDRILATGGMGIVYACDDTLLGRRVAVKVRHPEAGGSDERMKERFLQEGRTLARMDSAHVARVFDYGFDGQNEPFLVMELLEGRDLCDVLRGQGPLPPVAVTRYMRQACEGLLEVHRHHVVHRDIKPENLVVCSGSDVVKIIDFGISEPLGSIDRAGTTAGSPNYMAPEQLMTPSEHGVRADIWSLGVVMYELLTGHLPFGGSEVPDILNAILHATPPPISAFRNDVPSALTYVVSRCLEKDPRHRYHGALELAHALREIADTEELGFAPPAESGCRALLAASAPANAEAAHATQPIELVQKHSILGRSPVDGAPAIMVMG